MREVSVVGVPVYTLASYSGMGRSPGALRDAGLLQGLGMTVRDFGDASFPLLERDVVSGKTKNLEHFTLASEAVAQKVASVGEADLLVCVGGECSSVIGVIAGLRGISGKLGMVWMDTHGDFNTPETSPSGYIGGMCLAMACGRGPELGKTVEDSRPLVEEERLAHVGSRALDPPEAEMMRASPMGLFTFKSISLAGASVVAERISRRLEDSADWVMCHLDVDVLDPTLVPAVNYPTPGGMSVEQAATIIGRLRQTGRLRVLEICAYNADLDRDGSSARVVASVLRNSFP